ncbi:hypothetical protein C0995_009939 [Termitomyces sp. Mi166|nr:hypothetical protein C0995_009939 [Termitomyces sp. Mi166\
MRIELDYEQRSYVENLGVVQDKPQFYQTSEYSGGLGEGAAYGPPYMQDDLMDEGCYERPQQIRSYASAVMHSVLPARADYAQYMHPVDEVLLQCLEWAEQPVPAMVAFLQDDLAVMHVTALEQIEHMGKRKAPVFKEPMVEPKWARAPSRCPQELVWAPACTVAWLPPRPMKLVSVASTSRSIRMDPVPTHQVQKLDILAEPLAELSLKASDQIMSDAPAIQQEQRSEAPQVPVASSSKAGASSQGGA